MTVPLTDGTTTTLTRYLPAEGGQFISNLATQGPLQWPARTSVVLTQSGQWQRYSGASTSTTGDRQYPFVGRTTVFKPKDFYVQCGANDSTTMDGTGKAISFDLSVADLFVEMSNATRKSKAVVNFPTVYALDSTTRSMCQNLNRVHMQVHAIGHASRWSCAQ